MKKRQVYIIAGAVGIFLIARLISDLLGTPPERRAAPPKSNITTVFSQEVKTGKIPVLVESTGLIEAVERVELYSEVQGIMLPDGGRFKAGNEFSKGQILISIRADDKLAQLVSQRSAFERLLTGLMPDLKIDFPDDYPAWEAYLNNLDVNTTLPGLPDMDSSKLKLFLTGRNVYSDFYAVRNGEILYSKYQLKAPYSGELIEANVDPGTVIRQGQKLGVFIKPGVYELRVPADQATIQWVEKGQTVELIREGGYEKKFLGTVSRVNRSIDAQSQMSEFFVKVVSDQLKDGMFMQVKARTREVNDAFTLSRSVLFDQDKLYVVEDSLLKQRSIEAIHFYKDSVIVSGLKDGEQVLSMLPPGAFEGMKVEVYQENQAK